MLAFLFYNMRTPWRGHASVFLGDSGSYLLGFILAWVTLRLAHGYDGVRLPLATCAWILAVPGLDLFSVATRRLVYGQAATAPDRRHLHHFLLANGIPPGLAAPIAMLLTAVSGAIGVGGWYLGLSAGMMWLSFIAVGAYYWVYTLHFWQRLEHIDAGPRTVSEPLTLLQMGPPTILKPDPLTTTQATAAFAPVLRDHSDRR